MKKRSICVYFFPQTRMHPGRGQRGGARRRPPEHGRAPDRHPLHGQPESAQRSPGLRSNLLWRASDVSEMSVRDPLLKRL